MSQEALNLSGVKGLKVRVHPTAICSLLSGFQRREDKQSRVIGTLLGYSRDDVVEITDAFSVPHIENMEESYIAISKDYHKTVYDFHNRVNRREQIVGWYATTLPNGAWIVDNSSLVHDFYTNLCVNPVHLVVDITLVSGNVGVRAFVSRPMIVGQHAFANMFDELKVEIVLNEGEANCLYHMIHGQEKPWNDSLVLATIPDGRSTVVESMENMLRTIDDVIKYVNDVLDGKVPASATLGMSLADTLHSLRLVPPEELHNALHNKIQDMLMVCSVTTLARTQLNVTEKLNAIL